MKEKVSFAKSFKLLGYICLITYITAGASFAATYTVCDSGCDYTTLGAAIATTGAPSGSTIELRKNITEDLSFDNYNREYIITSDSTRRTWTNSSARNMNFINSGGYNLTFRNIDIANTGGSEIILMNQSGTLTFENCTLSNTSGSGVLIYMQNGGNMYFRQSEIIGNSSTPRGLHMASGVNYPGGFYLENTIVRDVGGVAIQCDQSTTNPMMYIYNSTFAGNGTAYQSSSAGVIRNSLFIGNTDDVNLTHINAQLSNFQYSGFGEQSSFGGSTGNVFGLTTSVFVNYSARDLHLDCTNTDVVDTGTDMSAHYTVDKDGLTRPQGDGYDMGAYECPAVSAVKSASVSAAYLGDTVTFCITVTNSKSEDISTYLWDTVPANTAYIDCDNGCDFSGGMVSWLIELGPGYWTTRCFWVRITGYPFLIQERPHYAGVNLRREYSFRSLNAAYSADSIEYWLAFNRHLRSKN